MRVNSTRAGLLGLAGDRRQRLAQAMTGAKAAREQLERVVQLVGKRRSSTAGHDAEADPGQDRDRQRQQQTDDRVRPRRFPPRRPARRRRNQQDEVLQPHRHPSAFQDSEVNAPVGAPQQRSIRFVTRPVAWVNGLGRWPRPRAVGAPRGSRIRPGASAR